MTNEGHSCNLGYVAEGIPCMGTFYLSTAKAGGSADIWLSADSTSSQALVSRNGAFQAKMQHDGNFVVYRISDSHSLWNAGQGTAGSPPWRLTVQTDGNIVRYAGVPALGSASCTACPGGTCPCTPTWNSGTWNQGSANGPFRLVMQNDGNLVLYNNGDYAPWATGTLQEGYPSDIADISLSKGTCGSCAACTAGKYRDAAHAACTDCSLGKYSGVGATVCLDCAAGKFSGSEAKTSATDCGDCVAGKYSLAGASVCTNCVAGKYSAAGAPVCTMCELGKYAAGTASIFCTDCEAGKFAEAGAFVCTDSGSTTPPLPTTTPPPAANAIASCPVGYGKWNATTCKPCPVGWTTTSGGATEDMWQGCTVPCSEAMMSDDATGCKGAWYQTLSYPQFVGDGVSCTAECAERGLRCNWQALNFTSTVGHAQSVYNLLGVSCSSWVADGLLGKWTCGSCDIATCYFRNSNVVMQDNACDYKHWDYKRLCPCGDPSAEGSDMPVASALQAIPSSPLHSPRFASPRLSPFLPSLSSSLSSSPFCRDKCQICTIAEIRAHVINLLLHTCNPRLPTTTATRSPLHTRTHALTDSTHAHTHSHLCPDPRESRVHGRQTRLLVYAPHTGKRKYFFIFIWEK
jgi:hypothetical protein